MSTHTDISATARQALAQSRRIVVKIGSRILVQRSGRPEMRRIRSLVRELAKLRQAGREMVFVTSGAIGTGMEVLGMKRRPTHLPELQMAAAVGQSRLMTRYDKLFARERCKIGQVLLTHDDLKHRSRHLNARNTMLTMLSAGIIPVVNENDAVAVDEIKFGDNDLLASLVVHLINADLLILLTTTDGLREPTASGRSRRVPFLEAVTPEVLNLASGKGSDFSTGGMASKLEAACAVAKTGAAVVVADGRQSGIIGKILAGADTGTLIRSAADQRAESLTGRKRWIAFFHKPQGALMIDDGARRAIEQDGKSLLPIGIKKVDGEFEVGAAVDIKTLDQTLIARGLVSYSSRDIRMIQGRRTNAIAGILGTANYEEVVHRDNMAIMNASSVKRRVLTIGKESAERRNMTLHDEMVNMGQRALAASRALALLSARRKNSILLAMADQLLRDSPAIQQANTQDMEAGRQTGLSAALLDRLQLKSARIEAMARGLREVAALPDPVGHAIRRWTRPNGLQIVKRRVPIGVIGIIYESRPNVTADAAALCFKTSNAVILRGGKEAARSNGAIVQAMITGGRRKGLPADAIQFIQTPDRDAICELVQLEGLVDLVIPRGGEALIRAVMEHARVPVIKHYKGVCHVFVDESADPDMALAIIENAKCQRPGVCNAIEKVLIHEAIAAAFLPRMAARLQTRGVELRGDEAARRIVPSIHTAAEADWTAEYLDLILAVRIVPSAKAAVEHINRYGSHHSDAIVTASDTAQTMFTDEVDSATVYVNASTRFTDGGEFGMGAEIGISTDKLHARGPMGLEELTTYKYVIHGTGQVRT